MKRAKKINKEMELLKLEDIELSQINGGSFWGGAAKTAASTIITDALLGGLKLIPELL